MKFSGLKRRAVISLERGERIGEVRDPIVEQDGRHIVSLSVRTGLLKAAKLLWAADVKNLSADAITVSKNAHPVCIPADVLNSGLIGPVEWSTRGAEESTTWSRTAVEAGNSDDLNRMRQL